MEFSPPSDIVDEVLGCVNLQWSTDDDADNTLAGISCNSGEDSLGGRCSLELYLLFN